MSKIGCPDNVVKFYDSIRSKHLSHHVKEQVADILHSKENSITITSMESQLQSNTSDCGLFAIGTAVSLCNGIPPIQVKWDQGEMRTHLITCFKKREILPFPGLKRSSLSEKLWPPLPSTFTAPAGLHRAGFSGRERWLSALSALSGTIKTVTMFHYHFFRRKN